MQVETQLSAEGSEAVEALLLAIGKSNGEVTATEAVKSNGDSCSHPEGLELLAYETMVLYMLHCSHPGKKGHPIAAKL